jgi:hypothetical protein
MEKVKKKYFTTKYRLVGILHYDRFKILKEQMLLFYNCKFPYRLMLKNAST